MERFCFKCIHFMYNGEHFSLPKIKGQGASFNLWRSLEKDKEGHTHSSERYTHLESVCVGIRKMLWASASWGVEAVLFRQVTDETLLTAADDYCIVRTIIAVKSLWITSRVGTWPTNSRWIISCKQICKIVCLHNTSAYLRTKFGDKFCLLRWEVMVALDFREKRRCFVRVTFLFKGLLFLCWVATWHTSTSAQFWVLLGWKGPWSAR